MPLAPWLRVGAFARTCVWLALALGLKRWALGATTQLVAHEASLAFALATRAQLRADAGLFDLALSDLQRLCVLCDKDATAHFNHGFVAAQLGMHGQAEAAYTRALALDPALDLAWYGLGMVHMANASWAQAAHAFRRNTELQPLSPCAWYRLAHVHAAVQDGALVGEVIEHLSGFEPQVAAQLRRELAA
jgi:Flp pilus assembly protein TadD